MAGQRDGDCNDDDGSNGGTVTFTRDLAQRNDGDGGGYTPPGPAAALRRGQCVATGDVRGGSRARDGDARHDAARCASSRRPRRPLPGRHTAIAPSGDSHDDRDAKAAEGVGAGVVVVVGGEGGVWSYLYLSLIAIASRSENKDHTLSQLA